MKIAIVTGASSGMGREFARQIDFLYNNLDEVWVIARRRERLEELGSQLSLKTRIFVGDLQDDEVYEEIGNVLQELNPKVKMVVNAAGFGKVGNVEEISCHDQTDMIHLNCMALVHMTKLCIPYMEKESRIVNLASASAFCPQPVFSVYAATKAFVLSFSRSLRVELAGKGITVTAVCPGPVETEFFNVSGKKENNGMKDAVTANPKAVVKKALLDAERGKELSVYGFSMKLCRIATKVIPHSIILKVMKLFW